MAQPGAYTFGSCSQATGWIVGFRRSLEFGGFQELQAPERVNRIVGVSIVAAALILSAAPMRAVQGPSASASAPAAAAAPDRAFLDKYCLTCHNSRLKTGGLTLDPADLADISAHGDVWEKVIKRLRLRTMPPANAPRPDLSGYETFATSLENALDAAAAAHPNPGRTEVAHRLNRAEYQNSVRDFLAIDLDVMSLLPADDSGEGG